MKVSFTYNPKIVAKKLAHHLFIPYFGLIKLKMVEAKDRNGYENNEGFGFFNSSGI